MENNVCGLVREMEQNDRQGNTRISKYVTYSQRENIDKIDAYVNSKHVSGPVDSLGREKPFFNIVTAARNIWYRATDIDRKNIRMTATKSKDYVLSFVATILVKRWMRKAKFAKFLNEWGRTLATYGSAVSRFVEKGGELTAEVIPWNRLICDPVDFDNNPKIVKIWLTPAQLREYKEYDQDMVEQLILALETRETADGQNKDNRDNYIEIYEVYGDFSVSYLTGKESDEDKYEHQLHVVSYVAKKEEDEYDDYTLYKGRKKPCMRIDHLIREDGRTMGIGAVEHLFEAQWMVNHSQKNIKDHLDLTSKYITQTADSSFVGQNVLSNIEQGDILVHKPNMPLTRVDNRPDITALQSHANDWRVVANEIASTSEAMKGATPKSGTAWRQTQAILMESHSLFEQMIENKGLALEEIMQEYVIPHLKKKMDTAEEIAEILEEHEINKLDTLFVPNEAMKRVNNKIIDDVLSKTPEDIAQGRLLTKEGQGQMLASEQQRIQKSLNVFGNQRFIRPSEIKTKTWKEVLKDFEWDIEVDTTGENKDKEAILATLTTVFQTVASNPGILQDGKAKMVFNRILEETGALSAVEINSVEEAPAPAMAGQSVGETPDMQGINAQSQTNQT